jgi:hypothetical protein
MLGNGTLWFRDRTTHKLTKIYRKKKYAKCALMFNRIRSIIRGKPFSNKPQMM